MRVSLPIVSLFVVACAAPQAVPGEIPEHAAMLSVAKCTSVSDVASSAYTQPLKPVGELKLFAEPALQGTMGGVNKTDVVYGRQVAEGVWAILVADYEKRVCEAYISADNAEIMANDPGPEPADPEPADQPADPEAPADEPDAQ